MPVHTALSMRIQSGSMRIRCVHTKSGSVQTGFKPVCFQSTSGGGFNPVRSCSKWICTCSHAIYTLFVGLCDDKSINAHVRTRRFNEVKTAGWTNDETRALVSVQSLPFSREDTCIVADVKLPVRVLSSLEDRLMSSKFARTSTDVRARTQSYSIQYIICNLYVYARIHAELLLND